MVTPYWKLEATLTTDPDNEDCYSLWIDEDGSGAEIAGKMADKRVANRLMRLWNDNRDKE